MTGILKHIAIALSSPLAWWFDFCLEDNLGWVFPAVILIWVIGFSFVTGWCLDQYGYMAAMSWPLAVALIVMWERWA